MFRRKAGSHGAYAPIAAAASDSDDSEDSDNSDLDNHTTKNVRLTGAPTDSTTAPPAAAAPATKPAVVAHKKQKGCHLEIIVQTLTMIGVVLSLGNISLSLKVVTDGTIPGVTVQRWLILAGVTAGWDVFIFVLMMLMMWRTFRTENTLQNGKKEAYPDDWYATYMESTGTAALISCLTLTLILIYYYRYAGEEPWDLSRYNVRDWEKPQQWVGAHYINISMRVVLLLRVYYRAYQFISEPTVIYPATAGADKSQ
jgi:hypothetical protein